MGGLVYVFDRNDVVSQWRVFWRLNLLKIVQQVDPGAEWKNMKVHSSNETTCALLVFDEAAALNGDLFLLIMLGAVGRFLAVLIVL